MARKLRNGLIGAGAGVLVAAVLVPTMAGGNARPTPGTETPLVAPLTGAAEVPGPGDDDGSGAAAVTIDVDNDEICYDLAVTGIEAATMAHIHVGGPTVAGPVIVDLVAPAAGSSSGCVIDTDAASIAADPAGFYVNVHNATFPAGAVRGQLATGPAPNNTYVLPTPLRAYDSRTSTAGIFAPGDTRTISLQSGMSSGPAPVLAAPPGATAALVTLTVTETEGAGYLKIYSDVLTSEPPTSNINWSMDGQNLAVATTVAIDEQGEIKVTAGFGSTHVVIDVVGFLY